MAWCFQQCFIPLIPQQFPNDNNRPVYVHFKAPLCRIKWNYRNIYIYIFYQPRITCNYKSLRLCVSIEWTLYIYMRSGSTSTGPPCCIATVVKNRQTFREHRLHLPVLQVPVWICKEAPERKDEGIQRNTRKKEQVPANKLEKLHFENWGSYLLFSSETAWEIEPKYVKVLYTTGA